MQFDRFVAVLRIRARIQNFTDIERNQLFVVRFSTARIQFRSHLLGNISRRKALRSSGFINSNGFAVGKPDSTLDADFNIRRFIANLDNEIVLAARKSICQVIFMDNRFCRIRNIDSAVKRLRVRGKFLFTILRLRRILTRLILCQHVRDRFLTYGYNFTTAAILIGFAT